MKAGHKEENVKKQMQKFSLGQEVEWVSTSGGSTTLKRGKVIAVIGEGLSPLSAALKVTGNGTALVSMFTLRTDFGGSHRDHESYLVAVPRGKTGEAKPGLYWPNVSALREL